MKNILFICLMMLFSVFSSSCEDSKAGEKTSKDDPTAAKIDSAKKEDKKDTIKKVIEQSEKKDTTSTVRQTEKTQVEEP